MRLHSFVRTTVVGLFLATSQPAFSQQSGQMNLGDFKNLLITYVELIGSRELLSQYESLTFNEWKAVYDVFPNKREFAEAVIGMEKRAAEAQSARLSTQPKGLQQILTLPAIEFTPRYPQGASYDAFVATLPGLGLLSDGDLPGTQDDRCDANGEANTRIAFGALQATANALDVLCNTIVVVAGEGTNLPACVAAGVVHEATLASQIVIDQCGYQTALVDSAEIEAAYENTRQIIAQIMKHDTDIKAILATIQAIVTANGNKLDLTLARQLGAIRLLVTPEGKRSTNVPACNGGPCTWPAK
jgi:hypothetical protein